MTAAAGHTKGSPENRIHWQFEQKPDVLGMPVNDANFDTALDNSWGELLRTHMAYQPITDDARARLLDALRQIELLFHAQHPDEVSRYYEKVFLQRNVNDLSGEESDAVRHIAVLQVHLLEQAYYTLKLGRFANAPTNRGWMNLFRRWGVSITFNTLFNELRPLVSRSVLRFYDDYVRDMTDVIDVAPVRHPWDKDRTLPTRDVLEPEDQQWERQWKALKIQYPHGSHNVSGVYLDSGIIETSSEPAGETGEGARAPKSPGPTGPSSADTSERS